MKRAATPRPPSGADTTGYDRQPPQGAGEPPQAVREEPQLRCHKTVVKTTERHTDGDGQPTITKQSAKNSDPTRTTAQGDDGDSGSSSRGRLDTQRTLPALHRRVREALPCENPRRPRRPGERRAIHHQHRLGRGDRSEHRARLPGARVRATGVDRARRPIPRPSPGAAEAVVATTCPATCQRRSRAAACCWTPESWTPEPATMPGGRTSDTTSDGHSIPQRRAMAGAAARTPRGSGRPRVAKRSRPKRSGRAGRCASRSTTTDRRAPSHSEQPTGSMLQSSDFTGKRRCGSSRQDSSEQRSTPSRGTSY